MVIWSANLLGDRHGSCEGLRAMSRINYFDTSPRILFVSEQAKAHLSAKTARTRPLEGRCEPKLAGSAWNGGRRRVLRALLGISNAGEEHENAAGAQDAGAGSHRPMMKKISLRLDALAGSAALYSSAEMCTTALESENGRGASGMAAISQALNTVQVTLLMAPPPAPGSETSLQPAHRAT
ncbi:hypothetical protein BC628DRAFT_1336116 [Trametes gibbosa]|nr:hypothetical protein BC628DRAFT_1336116 [Trametes gibbosa]